MTIGLESIHGTMLVLLRNILFGDCLLPLPQMVLLSGPPGVGKTSLMKEIRKDLRSEGEFSFRSRVPDILQDPAAGPCLFVLDDFELVSLGHPTISLTLQKLVANSSRVAVVAVVQSAENLSEECRRLFSHTFTIPVPNQKQRYLILKELLQKVELVADKDILEREPKLTALPTIRESILTLLAIKTLGFVGKDLLRMCRAAHVHALQKGPRGPGIARVEYTALLEAMKSIKAVPLAGLGDPILPAPQSEFSGYRAVRQKCFDFITWFAAQFEAGNQAIPSNRSKLIDSLSFSSGMLLYGPSGCGKSHLVRILAGSVACNWVSLKGSSIFSKYVGEAERVIRNTFRRAASIAPCVLVLDEIDALTRSRQMAADEDGGSARQVLSTLLCEMDGIEGQRGVLVIGCSNRPKLIDTALLRQGRLEHVIYLGPPSFQDRLEILCNKCSTMNLGPDVDLKLLAQQTDLFSCAALAVLCREASLASFRQSHCVAPVCKQHFEEALHTMALQPLSPEDIEMHYANFARK